MNNVCILARALKCGSWLSLLPPLGCGYLQGASKLAHFQGGIRRRDAGDARTSSRNGNAIRYPPAAGKAGGYFRIRGDAGLSSIALFGTTDLRSLGIITPQAIQ